MILSRRQNRQHGHLRVTEPCSRATSNSIGLTSWRKHIVGRRNLFLMPRQPKWNQNRCKACGYTWYPRGKSRSLKCPNCGSRATEEVGCGFAILVIGALLGSAGVAFDCFC